MIPDIRPWPPPRPGKRRLTAWVKITVRIRKPSPVAIQAARISLRTSGVATPQAVVPARAARTNRPSRPRIRSINIDAIAWVFLIRMRTRYAALMKSPPTAPGMTRLKT